MPCLFPSLIFGCFLQNLANITFLGKASLTAPRLRSEFMLSPHGQTQVSVTALIILIGVYLAAWSAWLQITEGRIVCDVLLHSQWLVQCLAYRTYYNIIDPCWVASECTHEQIFGYPQKTTLLTYKRRKTDQGPRAKTERQSQASQVRSGWSHDKGTGIQMTRNLIWVRASVSLNLFWGLRVRALKLSCCAMLDKTF